MHIHALLRWPRLAVKMGGGVFFVKKWTFPQRTVHYVQYQYFFILHFTYLAGAYALRIQRTPGSQA